MQKAYSFDQETLLKIARGALIAVSGSAAIGLLNYIGTIKLEDPTATMIVAWLIPTLVNLVKEWIKGN